MHCMNAFIFAAVWLQLLSDSLINASMQIAMPWHMQTSAYVEDELIDKLGLSTHTLAYGTTINLIYKKMFL